MKQRIDILGASAATLSMIFELIKDQFIKEEVSLRVIQNQPIKLEYPFAVDGVEYKVTDKEEVTSLSDQIFLGAYRPDTKRLIYNDFADRYKFFTKNFINLIHKKSEISSTADLRHGIQVNPLTTIAPYAEIDDFVSINRNVSIGHHSKISRFTTINPGVHIAGHCEIAEEVIIGMGSLILDGKKVGKGSIIGAGSLITKDIPERVLAMGSPAKIIKEL